MTTHIVDKTNSNPAYHLAVGSAGTARDLANFVSDPLISRELLLLAENFVRIAELLPESPLSVNERLTVLVSELADDMQWNWTRSLSENDAAMKVLQRMAKLGLIEHRRHPSGGNIWRVNGKLFGRTDGITEEMFESA